jgi:hypothetical protein
VQEDLDGAALIHRLVTLGSLVKGTLEVEDLARVDLAVPRSGRSARAGSGAPGRGRRAGARG